MFRPRLPVLLRKSAPAARRPHRPAIEARRDDANVRLLCRAAGVPDRRPDPVRIVMLRSPEEASGRIRMRRAASGIMAKFHACRPNPLPGSPSIIINV